MKTIWRRQPSLQSGSCTWSPPSPTWTSFSSLSSLGAPNYKKSWENPSFSSIQILVDFIPVASELFHHIWQHWPTACASSCLDICMHLVCLNPFHRILLIAIGLTWPFSQAVSALSLSLWISPCSFSPAPKWNLILSFSPQIFVPTLGTTLHLRSLSNMR